MVNLTQYLDPSLVCLLDAKNRDEAISALIDIAHNQNRVSDPDAFFRAVVDREQLVSTGIGMGVAIPHAKLNDHDSFFIAIGILQTPVDWMSLDRKPVRIIFLIGGPDDKQTEYLQILSKLTLAIKDEERKKQLLKLTSPDEIIKLFDSE